MLFRQLFDEATWTYTYLIGDEATKEAVLIDAVTEQADRDLGLLDELGYNLVAVLDTHAHADHITGADRLRHKSGAKVMLAKAARANGVDRALEHGDIVQVGELQVEARSTPGHTSGCMTFVVHGDDSRPTMAFTGDALFIRGTGRTDFQQGDSRTLYQSIHQQIFTLPDDTLVYPGHDYKGRTVSTVAEEKQFNPRVGGGKTEDDFVDIMNNLKLGLPKRLAVSLPKNMRSGAWAPLLDGPVPEVEVSWVLRGEGGYALVDVRSQGEYEDDHLPNAELSPLDGLEAAAQDWDKSAPVVLVCRSGQRSLRAAKLLQDMGFEQVASMRGGMIEVNRQKAAAAA